MPACIRNAYARAIDNESQSQQSYGLRYCDPVSAVLSILVATQSQLGGAGAIIN